jgi:pyruvate-formate lyase-activating enzyme
MSELVNKVALLATQISDPESTGVVVTGGQPLLKVEQIIALIREEIALNIMAYAQTLEKTMQKAAYECAEIARGEVRKWDM